MGRRGLAAIALVCWAAACAKAITDEPDSAAPDGGGGGDATTDVAIDNAGCPQFDLLTDPKHCGSCTNACDAGNLCSNGACKAQCDTPLTKCASDAGNVCANLTNDTSHCGQCTTACTTADAGSMAPGTNNPDPGIFLDGGYDGGPGWSLGTAACANSACGVDCPDAMALCSDQICYDTQNHHDHCGSCGTACAATTQWCTEGHCCNTGQAYCQSGCTNVLSDNLNCGACGNACDGGATCGGGQCSACIVLTGPSLTQNLGGWADAGLRFKALKNTTLTSFEFDNQGSADTLELTTTTGTVLQSITVPANTPTFTATVSWPLTSGTSYDIISVNGSNGHWDSYSTWPTTNASLEIDGVVDTSQTLYTTWWFSFQNMKTCP